MSTLFIKKVLTFQNACSIITERFPEGERKCCKEKKIVNKGKKCLTTVFLRGRISKLTAWRRASVPCKLNNAKTNK